jgi:hypothetical protein
MPAEIVNQSVAFGLVKHLSTLATSLWSLLSIDFEP